MIRGGPVGAATTSPGARRVAGRAMPSALTAGAAVLSLACTGGGATVQRLLGGGPPGDSRALVEAAVHGWWGVSEWMCRIPTVYASAAGPLRSERDACLGEIEEAGFATAGDCVLRASDDQCVFFKVEPLGGASQSRGFLGIPCGQQRIDFLQVRVDDAAGLSWVRIRRSNVIDPAIRGRFHACKVDLEQVGDGLVTVRPLRDDNGQWFVP